MTAATSSDEGLSLVERELRPAVLGAARYLNQSQRSDRMPYCPRCENRRWLVIDGKGAKRCRCVQRQINRKALAVIQIDQFGRPKLSRLQPRADLHPSQVAVIPLVKQTPTASFLLCGPNGCGKPHIAWALYRAALASRRRAIGCSLNHLLRKYRDWELMSPDERLTAKGEQTGRRPMVLPEDLQSAAKHTLFLDEFEKASVTEFTCRMLFELINTARDFGHQLIITSNKDWVQLREFWSRIDEVYGNSIMTRLKCCALIEMF